MASDGEVIRFTASHPCPVCGGHKELPQGQGERCKGYQSADGRWAWCSREEYAGDIPANANGDYRHSLFGTCRCGKQHAEDGQNTAEMPTPAIPPPGRGRPRREPISEKTYPIIEPWGDLVVYHHRQDFGPKDKTFGWLQATGEQKLPEGKKQADLPFYNIVSVNGAGLLVVTEGEKAADAVNDAFKGTEYEHRVIAVGWAGGASTMPNQRVLGHLTRTKTVALWPDRDDEGDALMRHIARGIDSSGQHTIKLVKTDDLPEHADAADLPPEAIRARIIDAEPWETEAFDDLMFEHACDIEPEEVEWLWTGRVPRGGITLIDGNPGDGKTGILLYMAAQVSLGGRFPFDTLDRPPGKVIYISAEEHPSKAVIPRLKGFGANLKNIDLLRFARDPKTGKHVFDASRDLDKLKRRMERDPAELIIIDPIQAHVFKSGNMNSASDTRPALEPIGLMAEEYNIGMMIARHFAKDDKKPAMMRGGGSIDIVGIARAQLVAIKKQGEEGEPPLRYLSRTKCNWWPPVPSIKYDITGDPFITWQNETSDQADDIVAPEREESGRVRSNSKDQEVLDLLRQHHARWLAGDQSEPEGMRSGEVAEELDRPASRASEALKRLMERELVTREKGRYRIRRDTDE